MFILLFYLFILIVFLALFWIGSIKYQDKKLNLPPGPIPVPLFGNLLSLSRNTPVDFTELSKKYGPIFRLWLGSRLAIVISDPELMKEAFINSKAWNGSPFPPSAAHSHKLPHLANKPCPVGIIFADADAQFKMKRSVLHTKLLRPPKLKPAIMGEIEKVQQIFDGYAKSGEEMDLFPVLAHFTMNIVSLASFGKAVYDVDGKPYSEQVLVDLLSAASRIGELTSETYVSDFVPILSWWERKKLKKLAEAITTKDILKEIVKEHRRTFNKEVTRDIIDEYMISSEDFDDHTISGIIGELLVAATLTTAHSMEWVFSHLIANLDIQERLRKEITAVIGSKIPEDLNISVPFLEATMKEAVRFCPVTPMMLPRKSMEDSVIAGYNIPENTLAIGNMYGACHSEKDFAKPDQFIPDRWLDGKIDPNFARLITSFGMGVRACPGQQLAELEMRGLISALLQRYKLLPSVKHPIDFTPHFALATWPKRHPKLIVRFK